MAVGTYDVLVLGAGLAGQRPALAAAEAGASVAVISKVHPVRSHSVAAAGGINAAVDDAGLAGAARGGHGHGPERRPTPRPARPAQPAPPGALSGPPG